MTHRSRWLGIAQLGLAMAFALTAALLHNAEAVAIAAVIVALSAGLTFARKSVAVWVLAAGLALGWLSIFAGFPSMDSEGGTSCDGCRVIVPALVGIVKAGVYGAAIVGLLTSAFLLVAVYRHARQE